MSTTTRSGQDPGERSPDGSADGASADGASAEPVPTLSTPGSAARSPARDANPSTSDRILNAALASFATRGYEATSLDALAKGLEITKQSILYWFPSKDAVLEAVIARSAGDLSEALESALRGAGIGWVRVEAVVRSVFRLAARQPELLGLLREVSRLGPPAATQMTLALEPLVRRASSFLEAEMDAGTMRRHDPRLLLLAIYSTVIGMVTEVEVLRALGRSPPPVRWCEGGATCWPSFVLRSSFPKASSFRSSRADLLGWFRHLFSRFDHFLAGRRLRCIALVGSGRFVGRWRGSCRRRPSYALCVEDDCLPPWRPTSHWRCRTSVCGMRAATTRRPRRMRANPSGAKIKVKEKPVTKNENTTRERFRRRVR